MSDAPVNPYRVGYRSIALSRLDWGNRSVDEVSPKEVADAEETIGEVIWDKERHVYVLVAGHGEVKWLLEHGGTRHRYWFHLLRERSQVPELV